jgi:NitT/TauT family transport system substrate-binding protein
MQTSQQNTLMIISRTPIPNIYRLKDMRVGCWKSGFSELPMILDRIYKLNIQWVPFRSNINLFISGAIDATMAMSYNEKVQLEMSGQRLNEDQLLYFSKLGYNIPEDGLYTTNSYLNTHREQVRRFVEASKRGWLWCVDHPQEALDIVMKVVRANNVATSRVAQQKMLKEILRTQLVKDTDQRTFRLDPNDFQFTNHFMLENGYIPKSIDYKTFVAE